MKMNSTGAYDVLEDGIFIEDPETEERMIFLLDPKGGVVLRSMLEEDIKGAVSIMDASRSQKRKKMKILWDYIPKKGSEAFFFVAEKILDGEETNPYEKERKIIGFGARVDASIEINVWEEEFSTRILVLVNRLADYFGIKGRPFLQSCK